MSEREPLLVASFVERANTVRKRIPFAYWLAYDAAIAPLLVWGFCSLSHLFAVGLAMLAVAAFFDVNEAFVKWARRKPPTEYGPR